MTSNPEYVLGHSERELQRLALQAEYWKDATLELLQRSGITTGMQIADVFGGAGYWTELMARAVGPQGHVELVNNSPYFAFAGKQLVPPEEMRQKLRAMLEARRDPDFFIVARTDAVAVTGLDDAIARLKSYAAVGADGLYVDAPESVEQLREISRQLKPLGKPLLFNMARSGKSPYLSLKEVYELGFDYALCPIEPMFAMHKAVKEMMEIMLREGSTNAIADRLTSFEDFNNFVGLPEVVAREKRFAS